MTGFKRQGKGNEEGIKVMKDGLDPLHRKNFMCSKSLDKVLFDLSTATGGKVSQSEFIRDAITKAYT
jgi:hypothetical protein